MADEMIVVRKNCPSFQMPVEVISKLQQAAMQHHKSQALMKDWLLIRFLPANGRRNDSGSKKLPKLPDASRSHQQASASRDAAPQVASIDERLAADSLPAGEWPTK